MQQISESILLGEVVVKTFHGLDVPQEVIDLRVETFEKEKSFLKREDLTNDNDDLGVHIAVYDSQDHLLGATHVMLAEQSDFSFHTGIPNNKLRNSIHSSRTAVSQHSRHKGIFSLLIYLASRWGRIQGRSRLLGFVVEGNPPIKKMIGCKVIPGTKRRKVNGPMGHSYYVEASETSIEFACFRAFETMSRALKKQATQILMSEELELLVENGILKFYETKWFQRVFARTLTKEQYILALANLHQYVRWTTRLLAMMAGTTEDQALRNQLLDHLRGEVDHEVDLERDLNHLGAETKFIVESMSPNPEIMKFMAIQQSLASFEKDPVLFLAAPLVAEGLSANLTSHFLESLESCVSAWGTESPKKAMSFLRSHIHTDGGDHGHWQAVQKAITGHLESESKFQRILVLVQALIETQCRAYDLYVEETDFHPGELGEITPLTGIQGALQASESPVLLDG